MRNRGHIRKSTLKHNVLFLLAVGYWLLASLPTVSAAEEAAESSKLPTFVVAGVKNSVDGAEWREIGVGFGVNNLIAQHLHDSGQFVPLEQNAEAVEAVKQHQMFCWTMTGKFDNEAMRKIESAVSSDYVVYGEVLDCKHSHKKAFAGFATRYDTSVKVTVSVMMVNKATGEVFSARGVGSAKKKASGLVFEAKDDKIDFSSTSVGVAVENAVGDAVDNLVMEFNNKKGGGR